MKPIQSIAVTAVALLFVVGAFAGTAVAAHDPKNPEHGSDPGLEDTIVPGGDVAYDAPPEDRFLKAKKAFDENDGTFKEQVPETGLIGFGSFEENFPSLEK